MKEAKEFWYAQPVENAPTMVDTMNGMMGEIASRLALPVVAAFGKKFTNGALIRSVVRV